MASDDTLILTPGSALEPFGWLEHPGSSKYTTEALYPGDLSPQSRSCSTGVQISPGMKDVRAPARTNATFNFPWHHSSKTPYNNCKTHFILAREKWSSSALDRCLRAEGDHIDPIFCIIFKQKREFELEECKSAGLEHGQDTGICTRAAIKRTREFLKTRAGQELRFISINPQQPWIPGKGVGWQLIQRIKMPPLVTLPIATRQCSVCLPPKQQSSFLYGLWQD